MDGFMKRAVEAFNAQPETNETKAYEAFIREAKAGVAAYTTILSKLLNEAPAGDDMFIVIAMRKIAACFQGNESKEDRSVREMIEDEIDMEMVVIRMKADGSEDEE